VTRALRWALLGGAVLLPAVTYVAVYQRYRLELPAPLPGADQQRIIGTLRAALDAAGSAQGARPAAPDAAGGLDPAGPLWVTVFLDGDPLFRTRQDQGPLSSRVQAAGRALEADPGLSRLDAAARRRARIKVDLTLARGPVLSSVPLLFAKSVDPGRDGLGLTLGQRTAYLLPDDLLGKQLLAGHRPFFFMHEFRTGLDLPAVVDLLAEQLEVTREQWRVSRRSYFRFRVQSFVEHNGRALPVIRGRVPVQRIDRATVRRAVLRATRYVMRQLRPDGRFEYIYYPLDDRHSPPGEYSLPRHAGTTWFLSLAYRTLKLPKIRRVARVAIDYLGQHAVPSQCEQTPYACVGNADYADLGSAALAVVAIAEYQQGTGDGRFLGLARRLGRFLLWMQKDNGDFCHQYNPTTRQKNCHDVLLYYSGEATLALAKLAQLTGDRRYARPLERALDFLTGEKYDFFLGQFFISEDHWTCIAAEAAYGVIDKDQYARFCHAFARLNRRAQVTDPRSDLRGALTVTPFFMPHNTPAGSRTEANVGTYLLSRKRGEPLQDVRQTVLRSLRYLVDQQIRPESAYLLPAPERAVGGMMQTPVRAAVRIDYVQHAAAAMARALPLLP
jgi:hypothetical protein